MKSISSLLVILIFSSCATSPPVKVSYDEPVVFTLTELSSSKDELFIKVNEWMIGTFTDAESVIQYSDKEAGTLIGKYLLGGDSPKYISAYSSTVDTRVYATIDIRVKQDKARLSVKPLSEWQVFTNALYDKKIGLTKEDVDTKIEALKVSLEKSLVKEDIDF